jgi:predicted flap endonuclease-1-like 5' DNA nuclease
MTTIVRVAAAAALCLGVAACGGGEDGNAASQSEELEPPTESSAQQSAPEVQNIPRPEQTMAAGRLSPVNNSGVTGSVNIRGIGEQTEVSLNVTGITQGN